MDLRVEVVRTGARRLWALASGLPPDAAVWREGRRWTPQDELAALAIEHADRWSWYLLQALGVKKTQIPEPQPIKHPDRQLARPALPVERSVARDPKVIAAWMRQHMN